MHKIRVFCSGISVRSPQPVGNLKNPRATRRARGPERRPERGAKRRTEAGAEARGPDGVPRVTFQFYHHRKNKIKILSKKVRDTQPNPRYQPKITLLCSDIAVYTQTYSDHITFHNLQNSNHCLCCRYCFT